MLNRLVSELVRAGLSEQDIADRITSKGVRTVQSTINRIRSGKIKNPGYDLGVALTDLHGEVCRKERRAPRQEARA